VRIATWNVNSVKQRVPRLLPWLDERRPDVVCLQETKLADDKFAELLHDELESRGYADPYPLKYEVQRRPQLEPLFVRTFMPDYQGATVWTSLGSMYLHLLKTVNPDQAKAEADRYVAWIERDRTFWEVIDDETGERYSSTFLTRSDESMLWSAIFLDLLERPDASPPSMRPLVPEPGS
jgi:hypothetical protein